MGVRKIFLLVGLMAAGCSEGGYNSAAPKVKPPPAKKKSSTENVTKKEPAKKPAESAAESVSQKLFNVAILTQSVQCLFCHMKIEGDVGGIQFPPNNEMHPRAGEGLRILGTLFGTNEIPNKLGNAPQAASTRPNYANTELKIFPTTKDGGGNIVFPTVTREMLAGKTKGTLKAGSTTVQDSHSGDLTLVDSGAAIELNGEVFVDGDLIIGGNYRGVGTIYARNIFIVKDLKAVSSAFPFPADPTAAKERGKAAISEKKDGAYLFALGQITVGYPDPAFLNDKSWMHSNVGANAFTRAQPSMGLNSYVALREQKNCNEISFGHTTQYKAVLVNKVDAFLYASDYLLWRTCNTFELNGGFVAPNVALVNAGDANPPQSTLEPRNVVRYDYRLRAGVKAFSVLKSFFEQE